MDRPVADRHLAILHGQKIALVFVARRRWNARRQRRVPMRRRFFGQAMAYEALELSSASMSISYK